MAVETFTATLPFEPRMYKIDAWVQRCLAEVRDGGKRPIRFSLSPPYGAMVDRSRPEGQSPVRRRIGGPVYVELVEFTLTVEVAD